MSRKHRFANLIHTENEIVSRKGYDVDYQRQVLRLRGYMCKRCPRLLAAGATCPCMEKEKKDANHGP